MDLFSDGACWQPQRWGVSNQGKGGDVFPAMAGERQLDEQRQKRPDLHDVYNRNWEGWGKRERETREGCCGLLSESLLYSEMLSQWGKSLLKANSRCTPKLYVLGRSRFYSEEEPFANLHRGAKCISRGPRWKKRMWRGRK